MADMHRRVDKRGGGMTDWILWAIAAGVLAVAFGTAFWPDRPWKRKPMPSVYGMTDDEVKFLQIVMAYKHETATHPTEGLSR